MWFTEWPSLPFCYLSILYEIYININININSFKILIYYILYT